GRQAAQRLGIPFVKMGLPLFDCLGAAHRLSVGYRGTRDLVFELGNLFIANLPEHHVDSWPLPHKETPIRYGRLPLPNPPPLAGEGTIALSPACGRELERGF
ncbi:MAG: hypothetical protein M0Z99_34685, partial [Betaproteobacteria bacterium]|nr:hypothetical protein [Betaproteobacteria bacterium]